MTYGDYVLDFFYDVNGTPIAMRQGYASSSNYTVYYYITNLQGDVIRLVDVYGNTAAYYEYDPYGNATNASGSHATINPLRYRGYVYDTETTLYYLQSRYYDPELGRFINVDGLVSTGQGILGNNMFAYCLNDSVNYCDLSGCYGIFSPSAMARNSGSSLSAIPDELRTEQKLKAQAMNLFNTSEEAVLYADYFAFYRGVPVIKVPSMETSALSMGFIFLGSDVDSVGIVRHEYGHTKQLSQLGLLDYLMWIGIPSKYYFDQTMNEKYSWDEYYERPWELLADIFGGVDATHSEYAQNVAELYWRLARLFSIFT